MILNGKDVSDDEFFNRIVPIDNNFKNYMISFIIPEVVAFYLKDCFYKNCLCDSPLYNHINSMGHRKNYFVLNKTGSEIY